MEQQFVKNPDVTIKDMLKAKNASKVLAFVRFEKGEGIEKRQENFADEIAKNNPRPFFGAFDRKKPFL